MCQQLMAPLEGMEKAPTYLGSVIEGVDAKARSLASDGEACSGWRISSIYRRLRQKLGMHRQLGSCRSHSACCSSQVSASSRR